MSNLPPPLRSSSPTPPPMQTAGEVLSYAQPAFMLPFADKRTGLKAWGIVLIVLGAIAGCVTLLIPFGALLLTAVPANQVPNRGLVIMQMIVAALMYGVATGLLIWIGIASLRFRKWVRPIVLTFSGVAIGLSVAGAISLVVTAPAMGRSMSTLTVTSFAPTTVPTTNTTTPPPTVRTIAVPNAAAGMWLGIFMGVLMIVGFGIALPGAMFWFYRQEATRQTLEYFDQVQRWSDKAPVPILAVALTATAAMIMMMLSVVQQIFMFDGVQGGLQRAAILVGMSLVVGFMLFITAALNFHNSPKGWIAAIVTVILATAGWLVQIDLIDVGAQMQAFGVNTQTSASFGELTSTQKLSQMVSTSLVGVGALVYLLWCRKFYPPSQTATRM